MGSILIAFALTALWVTLNIFAVNSKLTMCHKLIELPLSANVNLIFSFGNTGDSQVQVLDPPARTDEVVEKTSEPVHRVRKHTHHFTLEVTIEGLHCYYIFSSPKHRKAICITVFVAVPEDITGTC